MLLLTLWKQSDCITVHERTLPANIRDKHAYLKRNLLRESTEKRIQNLKSWFTFYAIKSKPKQLFKFRNMVNWCYRIYINIILEKDYTYM